MSIAITTLFLAKRYENDRRVAFQIPDGPDALFQVYGHRYLLTHGDTLGKGGDGIIGALGPGTAAPTTGTWNRGEVVWRSDATAGVAPGWICTTAGTPGTWKAMANLAP